MEFFLDAYRRYADFSGRANRQKYWMFYLFYIIAYILLAVIDMALGTDGILAGLFALGSFVPSIAITARRLHDVEKSGWWQLIILVPLIGALVMIYFTVKDGTLGSNSFGEDPLTRAKVTI